jgi:CheY-like chemotaxis protein
MLQAHAPSIEVHVATTVEGAMALLDSAPPDLMLLDLALQGGTGWELLALKQQHPHLLPIPAVIISAQDPMERSLYSPLLMASMGDGLSLSALTVGTRALLELLLNGAGERDPMSG